MISKGIGDIRSLHTINTRPGPMTEKDLLLRLYKLASQKANFQKKKEWAERQRIQAIRHLIDIQREIGWLKKMAMGKIGSSVNPGETEAVETKGSFPAGKARKKWNEIPLRY